MKKYIILIILSMLLILGVFVVFTKANMEGPSVQKLFTKEEYKTYKSGDVVTFNKERWYVLHDSSKKQEYVTLISSDILFLDDEKLSYVLGGIYETSEINKYLSGSFIEEMGKKNFIEINGYKARLFNQDDFKKLIDSEYNEKNDQYIINNCPEFICLTNTHFATMIDTNTEKEFVDVYNNVGDIENLLYGDYTLHLKYYNVASTYETHNLVSLVDDATLFVRPVINVYKNSIK